MKHIFDWRIRRCNYMGTWVVTAQVEVEVEANNENEAISNAENELGFDVTSFRVLSAESCDEEDE